MKEVESCRNENQLVWGRVKGFWALENGVCKLQVQVKISSGAKRKDALGGAFLSEIKDLDRNLARLHH